jgi:hypothetical protein
MIFNLNVPKPGQEAIDAWNLVIKQIASFVDTGDAEFVAPTEMACLTAVTLAAQLRDAGYAPARVVPGGEGDICFEWHVGTKCVLVELLASNVIETMVFENCKMVSRGYSPTN